MGRVKNWKSYGEVMMLSKPLSLKGIKEALKDYITEERFRHSIGVMDTAVRLAAIYGCKEGKVEIASLLHDVARDMSLEKMQCIVRRRGLDFRDSEVIMNDPLLLHAYAGKVIAEEHFAIQDQEILRSIELHTTGGVCMSLLDKVLFVADYIESGRAFIGVKKARILAYRNIDSAALYIFKSLLIHLLRKGVFICKNTLLGYNELILKSSVGASAWE